MKRHLAIFVNVLFTGASAIAEQKTVTIATVNNPAMIELKKLSPKFEAENPNIKLNWVVLEENILRQRVTTDVSTEVVNLIWCLSVCTKPPSLQNADGSGKSATSR